MRCANCGFENPEGMRFCGQCASPLSARCPQCGFANPPGFAFCGQCAAALTVAVPGPESGVRSRTQERSPQTRSEAERRQLTVMFCDLVGSTALSAQLDPEELREVMRTYQEACVEAITHFDGHLAKYLGDGLLVYFGYPVAHEESAQRAVRAGLKIVEAIHQLPLHNTRSQQPLQVRIGIHTGLVVAGEMGSGDYREALAIVGETPNLAARLQDLAEPDTVVISAATFRLTQGFFACRDLGPHALKGIATPVQVYRVLGESGARSRLEVAATAGLTPLVGREQEVGLLLGRWERTKEGTGQVVLMSGEAGIGKSRLLQALKEHIADETYTLVELRCSSHHQNSALYPVIDHFQRLLQVQGEDSPQAKSSRLEKLLEQAGLSLPAVLPLFATLLSLPAPHFPLPALTPQRQKQKTLQALLAWFLREAEQRPLLLIVEDLHWVDPSTLEFLSLLLDQAPMASTLIVLTFRPDFTPPWVPHSHMTQLTLGRLGRKQVEAMVEGVARDRVLPAEVLQQVVAKTDGVPLFVEELTKMVLESGLVKERHDRYELTSPLPPLAIPTTLHDSLMARLDRLSTVKEVAQLGATLGREFTYDLLRAVSPLDEAELQRDLARLVKAELLYQRGFPPQARYIFKHALIQDAAYQSLLRSTRQQYHKQIAQILAERFREIAETQPELLAHHYTEAGLFAQAVPYWQQAGQRAIERSAHVEAISHLTKGLELLKTLPQTSECRQQELTLHITLGVPLTATKGYAAAEVGKVYTRARELCRQMGESPQLFPVLFGLWRFYLQRAELQTARELAEQCLSLAERVQDPARLLRAHNTLGVTLFFLGELVPAREHLERGIALYSPQQRRSLASVQDPVVVCLAYAAWALWHLGYPDQALKRSQEALTLAQELSHPYSSAMALFFAAELHYLRREVEAVRERAEAAVALSAEQEFPFWLAQGTCLQGWVLTEQGRREEGIAQMRRGLAIYQATGAELGQPYWLVLPTAVQGQGGQVAEGLNALAEAHAAVHKSGERYYEAELYRLKGELMLQQSGVRSPASAVPSTQHLAPSTQAEAEACFHKAV
ncbi:MAG TPA: adenylate/guanylate cyclase domain-containing protein, partial [Candidatus Binatia bacterium]|nr:adenylate/guanylate cyclase domain-containing protein [Candidatus Binatia bacterium]